MCQSEVSELNELHNEFKDEGLMVVGIVLDSVEPKRVRTFKKEYAILYQLLLDDGRVSVA